MYSFIGKINIMPLFCWKTNPLPELKISDIMKISQSLFKWILFLFYSI